MRLPGPEVGSAPEPRPHMLPTSTHRACTAAPRVLQTHGRVRRRRVSAVLGPSPKVRHEQGPSEQGCPGDPGTRQKAAWGVANLDGPKPQASLVTWEVRACLRKPQDW